MKHTIFFWALWLSLVTPHAIAQQNNPQRANWFREARFGMFVHWGLYSILGGSYGGRTLPDTTLKNGRSWYAEWIQQRLEVPEPVYRKLVKQFNPVLFNADQWILEAKNAGMRYFVITAKHHDGFALWDSKVSTYDLGSTAYKKDILGELAKACRKYGLKFGFYYSHCEDWDHPGGATPSWLPQKSDAAFAQYWKEKCLPQVRELIERYDPDLFWFDTWGDAQEKIFISDQRRDELITMIRKLSPKCLINGRISWLNPGNEIDFLEMMDNEYPEAIQRRPWQTPATMVHSWGWHAKDYNWKPASEMLGYLVSNVAKGGNYLLNIGPKSDGTIPAAAVHRLREMGGWMEANGEAIRGTMPVEISMPAGVVATQRKTDALQLVYLSVIRPLASDEVVIPLNIGKIVSCKVLETGMPVRFEMIPGGKARIILPDRVAKFLDGVQVLKVEVDIKP